MRFLSSGYARRSGRSDIKRQREHVMQVIVAKNTIFVFLVRFGKDQQEDAKQPMHVL